MVLPFLTRAKMLNQTETSRRVCQTRSDDETEEEKTMDRILLALVLQPSLDIGARFYICTEPSLGNECKETHKEEPDECELEESEEKYKCNPSPSLSLPSNQSTNKIL